MESLQFCYFDIVEVFGKKFDGLVQEPIFFFSFSF